MRTNLLKVARGAAALLCLNAGIAVGEVEELGTTQAEIPWTMPGVTVSSPTGFGARWGQAFIGGGYQQRARRSTGSDGALGLGFGIGNPTKIVGIETSISILDLSGFARGAVNVKVHRTLPKGFAVSVGREALASWGNIGSNPASYYGAASKVFYLRPENKWFSAMTLTAGVGNGRFRTEADTLTDASTVNVFGSVAMRIRQPVSAIIDYTGQDVNLGLSITPFRKIPFFINPSIVDVTGSAGDGTRFTLGAGIAYTFGA